jgi:tripartite-type tricarboxylate transporter receptor subunit TctC
MGQLAYCVVVHPSVPVQNMTELVQWLKASPGKHSDASPDFSNIAQLAAEAFKQAAGVDILHVP